MIVRPAIDFMNGAVVQLVAGDPERRRLSHDDADRLVADWRAAGCTALHVVDLDAALGRGANARQIRELIAAVPLPVQVGGGIREHAHIESWLEAGADTLIVGTRAVQEPRWLEQMARAHPDRLVLAADVRGDEVVIKGWQHEAGIDVHELLTQVDSLPLAGVLITDVEREGQLRGVLADRYARFVEGSRHDIQAAGSIRDADDLVALRDAGVREAVVGTALYTGDLSMEDLQGFWRAVSPHDPNEETR